MVRPALLLALCSVVSAGQTIFRGSGMRVHHEALDGSARASASSSSMTTTSTSSEPSPGGGGGVYAVQIPVGAFYRPLDLSTQQGSSAYAQELASSTSSGTLEGSTFIRPAGELPLPPGRFGFDGPAPSRTNDIPNCGCVQPNSCIGAAGAYTRQVWQYSDIACGLTFERCCFDGPWPGTLDSFASVASCVAKELCLRPYGVLPTDVRDFGTIPPCPGHGAVRCISVDSAGLLEFQTAVAAIEAANFGRYQQGYQINPLHVVVPFMEGGGSGKGSSSSQTQTQTETTSSVDLSAVNLHGSGDHENEHPYQVIVQTAPGSPAPNPVLYTQQQQSPNVFLIQVPAYQQQQVPPPAAPVVTQTTAVLPAPAPTVVAVEAPQGHGFGGHGFHGYGRGPYGGGFYGYPGYGYGAGAGGGLGFRKNFHFSKSFGFGGGYFRK